MVLNADKSRFMMFGSNRSKKFKENKELVITTEQVKFERVESFKYLGIIIHQHMTWTDHVDELTKKINQRIALLRRIKYLLPIEIRRTLYMALVAPLFDYADVVWGDKNNETLMNNLQLLQNRAAKIILDRPKYSSATDALEVLDFKPLSMCRKSHRLIAMFKHFNEGTDFNCNLVLNKTYHNYNTRKKNDIHLHKVRTNWGKQMFTYQASNEWNSLSESIKDSQTL